MIFSEKLPPLWWVGAAGLVVGNVVIGRREEESIDHDKAEAVKGTQLEGESPVGQGYRDYETERDEVDDDDILELDIDVVDKAKGKDVEIERR